MYYYKMKSLNPDVPDMVDKSDVVKRMPWEEISKEEYDIGLKKLEIYESVEELKRHLFNTDYKIIKCFEAFLAAKHPDIEMPYDIDSIITERQEYRNRINEIEVQLA